MTLPEVAYKQPIAERSFLAEVASGAVARNRERTLRERHNVRLPGLQAASLPRQRGWLKDSLLANCSYLRAPGRWS